MKVYETRSNGGSSDPPDCPANSRCSHESMLETNEPL
jgi:hypothetical protein